MNTMEMPSIENKAETLKTIIENISAINDEMDLQLQIIADALVTGSQPSNNDKHPDKQLPIIESLRCEREKAEKNLKLLVSIRGYLW